MAKILVTYFSASGVTARAAEAIARRLGADRYEIKPRVPYTPADLDWRDAASRSTLEMKDPASRPQLMDADAPVAAYDTVLIGFPIWWYVAPTVINTFLESYDFSGKRVVLFATSGGSGFGNTAQGLKPSLTPGTTVEEGRVFIKAEARDDALIESWADTL